MVRPVSKIVSLLRSTSSGTAPFRVKPDESSAGRCFFHSSRSLSSFTETLARGPRRTHSQLHETTSNSWRDIYGIFREYGQTVESVPS